MSICAVVGLSVGFFILVIFLSLIQSADSTPTALYNVEIQPNANGARKILSRSSPAVLKLNIQGSIGGELLNTHTVNTVLTESRENTLRGDRVKAVLVTINSPGGTITDADGIYRAILQYKKQHQVPVYAFVDGLCASGGMYIASACDKIYATDASLIGSVGVLTGPFMNVSQLLEKFGVSSLTLTAGKGKDDLNPLRAWAPGEEKPLKEIVDYYYNYFLDVVTKARPNLSREKLISDYGARVFPAQQAVSYGYIDEAGAAYESVLSKLLKEIGIEDDYYQVVELSKSPWAALFQAESSPLFGKIKHTFSLPYELEPALMSQPYLYLYRP